MSRDLGRDVPDLEKLYARKLWAAFSHPTNLAAMWKSCQKRMKMQGNAYKETSKESSKIGRKGRTGIVTHPDCCWWVLAAKVATASASYRTEKNQKPENRRKIGKQKQSTVCVLGAL